MNIQNAVEKGFNILKKHNIKSSILDSEILLSKAIQKERKFIILNPKVELDTQSNLYFDFLINQRSKGKPIAYILGKKEFWKYEFIINEDVLIPRPDTELIVEQVLKITKNKPKLSILDIGVGSGCILLSILKERKNYKGIGIDISKKCIDICKINTLNLHYTIELNFLKQILTILLVANMI